MQTSLRLTSITIILYKTGDIPMPIDFCVSNKNQIAAGGIDVSQRLADVNAENIFFENK